MIEIWVHKPPMKAMLYAIARCYSLNNALKAVNKDYPGLDLTEEEAYKKLKEQPQLPITEVK